MPNRACSSDTNESADMNPGHAEAQIKTVKADATPYPHSNLRQLSFRESATSADMNFPARL
jgi:hypothetical protein